MLRNWENLATKNTKENRIIFEDSLPEKQVSELEVINRAVNSDVITEGIQSLLEEDGQRASENFQPDLENRVWVNYYNDPKKIHNIITFRRDAFR